MQTQELIELLAKFPPHTFVKIAVQNGDETDFEDVAEVERQNLFFSGQCVVLHPFNS